MKVSGRYTLAAPRQQVWAALQDPAVLARTIPGCESLEVTAPDCYAATVTAGVASVKGTYQGRVSLSDKDAPASYRLHAEGAGAPGTIRADATIRLDEVEDGTCVFYDADAVVGGMIGGVGQRMIAGVAKKTAGEFFSAVERELVGGPAVAPTAPAAPTPTPGAAPSEVGQVFSGAPATAAASADTNRLVGLLAAFGLGALVALAGVLVGRRIRP